MEFFKQSFKKSETFKKLLKNPAEVLKNLLKVWELLKKSLNAPAVCGPWRCDASRWWWTRPIGSVVARPAGPG